MDFPDGPAIEESVRFHAPVQAEPRVTTEEVVLGGVTIPRARAASAPSGEIGDAA